MVDILYVLYYIRKTVILYIDRRVCYFNLSVYTITTSTDVITTLDGLEGAYCTTRRFSMPHSHGCSKIQINSDTPLVAIVITKQSKGESQMPKYKKRQLVLVSQTQTQTKLGSFP